VPAYLYAEREADVAELTRELPAARDAGLSVSFTQEVPLPFATRGALRVEDQAQLHPRAYLRALAEAVEGDGSHVFERTRVVEVKDGSPCRVLTDRGTVVAEDVVEATTTPLNRVALHTKLYPYRSYALAARLEQPLPAGLYYDLDDPYHYVRTHPAPGTSGSELLIVGGEDHKVGEASDTQACFARLESWARGRFALGPVVARWSGQVIEPADGLPYIGRNVASRHTWVATGFSGTGMTFGTLSGMVLTDLVLGRPNAWAQLFEPGRVKPAASAKDFVQENADVAFHWVADRLSRAQGASLADVPAGEGRILSVEGRKVAVYREPGGGCHAVSPVCTHLGCHVHWNGAERSWDCPCHGARFSPTGRVLNGPAMKDLPSRPLPPSGEPTS
jgi:glycine/D-amino acid oxidase-like deaminating enzyme/nitrite reductase/ring-hydroxylating ferredoxin subunit